MEVHDLLDDLVNESTVYFGDPWRYKNTEGIILPIITRASWERNYVLLSEAQDQVKITDTGSISKLDVENSSGKNVLVRTGEVLKGSSTQPRTFQRSAVIAPNKKETVEVKCIQASHPITPSSSFRATSWTAPKELNEVLLSNSYSHHRQSVVWQCINSISTTYYALTSPHLAIRPSDSLIDAQKALESGRKVLSEMISHVPIHSKQVGAVFFKGDKVLGMEMFDSPDSWNAAYEAAIKKYGYNLTSPIDESVLDVKVRSDVVKEKAKEFIRKVIQSGVHDKVTTELYESGILESNEIVGEYVKLDDRVIYVVALAKEMKDTFKASPNIVPRTYDIFDTTESPRADRPFTYTWSSSNDPSWSLSLHD